MSKNLNLFFDKIVVGDNITGMLIALNLNAVFIPVSFVKSFSWDYSNNIDIPIIDRFIKNHLKINKDRTISSPEKTINVKYYHNELFSFFLFLLKFQSLIFDNFTFTNISQREKDTIYLSSRYGLEYIVNYNQLFIVNPSDWYFSILCQPTKRVSSKYCHIIDYLKINKNSSDMKGVIINYDTENAEGYLFNKVYYSSPFGQKKYEIGYSPHHKSITYSTKNICFITNNLLKKDLYTEQYSVAEYRKDIYKYLSIYNKRIAERYLNFDEDIERIILSTNVDIYKDLDFVKFIYYEDKEEIICEKQFQFMKQLELSQRPGLNLLFSTINSIYSCQSTKI